MGLPDARCPRADDAAVTDILVLVVANRTLDDISKSVESACAAPHRSGRASADVLRDLVAAVCQKGEEALPPGFVNERLVASACLPPERLRGVVATALVAPEVRAEDDCYAAQGGEGSRSEPAADQGRRGHGAAAPRRRARAGASDDEVADSQNIFTVPCVGAVRTAPAAGRPEVGLLANTTGT